MVERPSPAPRRARLADVAAAAGVSERTVANVVRDHPHVRPELRARVKAAIDELGYVPNATARRLATGTTHTLAVAVPDVDVPYFAEIASRLTREAARRGYAVVMELTGGRREDELAVVSRAEAGQVDGVLFHPAALTPAAIGEARRRTPLVVLGEADAPASVDHVMIDNVAGARDAVAHLVGTARSRIGFLGLAPDVGTTTLAARHRGFREALAAAGIPARPALEPPVQRWTHEEGARAARALLDSGERFDALVCCDDRLAIGALSALTDRGVRVPEDVAVTGWDDLAVAPFVAPALTSVSPDKDAIARTAVDLLIARLAAVDAPGRHEIVAHRLVVRASA